MLGELIAGRYRIDALIGEGSMGAVYAANDQHRSMGTDVAIKILHPRHLREAEVLSRFVREARVASKLQSDSAVRVFDVGMHGETPYFVMERLSGVDLQRHLASVGKLSVARAADYLLQACDAIAEAHTHGIVHRDLKLANLFLARGDDGRDRIKVIDFGVSKLLRPLDGDGAATATTVVVGTPAFMAPEQMRSSDVDHRVDIWALGVTLYWLVTGQRPFDGDSIVKIYESILRGPEPVCSLAPDAPAALDELINQTLVWDPAERLDSVATFAEALVPLSSTPGMEIEDPPTAVQDRTELLDPAAIDLPPLPPQKTPLPWPRIGVGAAIVALAAGSYALGRFGDSDARSAPAPAARFTETLVMPPPPRAARDAGAIPPSTAVTEPVASAAPASASVPVKSKPVPRYVAPRPPSSRRAKKDDEVWGMP